MFATKKSTQQNNTCTSNKNIFQTHRHHKKFLHNIKKQHTNTPPQRQTSFKPQSPLFTQCHKQYFRHQKYRPNHPPQHQTIHNIHYAPFVCRPLHLYPDDKKIHAMHANKAHIPPFFYHTSQSPPKAQTRPKKQTAHTRAHNKKNTHHTLQQLRPRRPAQTIHNTQKNIKKRHKKNRDAAPFFIKIKYHILYLTLCYF